MSKTNPYNSNSFYLRIFDENHKGDWKFFFVCALVCNMIYFLVINRMEFEYGMFPIGFIVFNMITPIVMLLCELGERSIYG